MLSTFRIVYLRRRQSTPQEALLGRGFLYNFEYQCPICHEGNTSSNDIGKYRDHLGRHVSQSLMPSRGTSYLCAHLFCPSTISDRPDSSSPIYWKTIRSKSRLRPPSLSSGVVSAKDPVLGLFFFGFGVTAASQRSLGYDIDFKEQLTSCQDRREGMVWESAKKSVIYRILSSYA